MFDFLKFDNTRHKYKKKFITSSLFHLFLCSIFIFCASFQGINYYHLTTSDPLSIHILEVDPSYSTIRPAHAKGQALGRETVHKIASSHQALAAVNAGFFKYSPWNGLPAGILKIEGKWFSFPFQPRGAIGWEEGGENVIFDQLLCQATLEINSSNIMINGLNRQRADDEIILFLPTFNRTTLTRSDGIEIAIQDEKILSIQARGNSEIPKGGYILSIGPKQINAFWKNLQPLMPIKIKIDILPQTSTTTSEQWNSIPNIVGGTPILIRKGKKITDFSSEKTRQSFLDDRHARTAVGLRSNGQWVFAVIDGKQSELSRGMTMNELATFMFEIGCTDALNLDGGGSSTMVLDGKVVNDPVGDEDEDANLKKVRRVADAILIFEKK